ncbi:MAG: 1-acyl-sn-glycerol-3-phosphate acyltransferase [Bacteroidota bacterium]
MDLHQFDDLRPYNNQEVPEAVERMLLQPLTYQMLQYVYPGVDQSDAQEMLKAIKNTEDFQVEISAPAFKMVAQMTTNGLTFSNMESIEKGKPYLFLSNHRDIILDSALLNVSLLEKGFETTQIAIGDNLLKNPIIEDIVRLNKSFIVHRNAAPKEGLLLSKRLSNYIRQTITKEQCSIWIAHKEGRSKDGNDRTASGLLKMLCTSTGGSIAEGMQELNIVPTAVSYEYDPCDLFKANELLMIEEFGEYTKEDGEDYRSAMKGITGHKGRVNIALGKVLNEDLKALEKVDNKNDQIRLLSNEIDRQIHSIYRLWPTNYIAYDLLNGNNEFTGEYNRIQRIAFSNYLRGRVLKLAVSRRKILKGEAFRKQARQVLLTMYANPVKNWIESKNGVGLADAVEELLAK